MEKQSIGKVYSKFGNMILACPNAIESGWQSESRMKIVGVVFYSNDMETVEDHLRTNKYTIHRNEFNEVYVPVNNQKELDKVTTFLIRVQEKSGAKIHFKLLNDSTLQKVEYTKETETLSTEISNMLAFHMNNDDESYIGYEVFAEYENGTSKDGEKKRIKSVHIEFLS